MVGRAEMNLGLHISSKINGYKLIKETTNTRERQTDAKPNWGGSHGAF